MSNVLGITKKANGDLVSLKLNGVNIDQKGAVLNTPSRRLHIVRKGLFTGIEARQEPYILELKLDQVEVVIVDE